MRLNDHKLVFDLYLSWVKESKLFYLSLVNFEVCGPKEDVRLVIRKKFEKPIVLKMPKWAWHGLMWSMWEVRAGVPSPS